MMLEKALGQKETETTRLVRERKSSLIANLQKRHGDNAYLLVSEAIAEYGGKMREKYGEKCENIEAFHALIGSGLPVNRETVEDFPAAEDSATKFLNDLERRLLAKETV